MEENPKERFEEIKKAFYSSDFNSFIPNKSIEVSKSFINDFEFLIRLVDELDKYNHQIKETKNLEKLKSIKDYEMISFIDIIKTLSENREKINEIIEFNQDSGNHIPHID